MKTRFRRVVLWVTAGLMLAFALLCLPYDPPRWSASEISERVDLLNENAAVTTPHHTLGKKTREANLALFEKVERGQPLSADESATRVHASIGAYKNLTDIIEHMGTAPQTKSVPNQPVAPADELQQQFESMMVHYKRAQFEPVNSAAYVTEVHLALDSYDAIVALVQDRIHDHLGPLERSLSGRWGSWRSLGPPLGGVSAERISRRVRR